MWRACGIEVCVWYGMEEVLEEVGGVGPGQQQQWIVDQVSQ